MGLFIQQNDNRSQLQERLAAELREKAKLQANNSEPLDQTKHSNYLKNTEQTSSRAWIWFLIGGIVVLGVAVFMIVR